MSTHEQAVDRVRQYIREGWRQLERGNRQLLSAAIDPKLGKQYHRWPVYVSAKENLEAVRNLLIAQMKRDEFEQIDLRQLPADLSTLTEHGLLYLPHDYVVPGGRFNEQYGWDSYWIVLGLLRDGELVLAKKMVDNFLYQITHYGMILNANRSYYLTRSHPPLLTGMILAVFQQTQDADWLGSAVPMIEQYYQFWMAEPHYTPATGLSRYYDHGFGPAPEALADERDAHGRTHYDRVQAFFRAHTAPPYDYGYEPDRFYDATQDCLTPLFYVADRSMRESGFDPSDRFGSLNLGVIDMNPVCLNTLLFLMERDLATIHDSLGHRPAVAEWEERAARRAVAINQYMWDEDAGLYFDYNFTHGMRRVYPFLTTFYPLWAGIATESQAQRVVANLQLFEAPGGLLTSTTTSGCQWDAPFGWAPLQMIAVKGLRRYGAEEDANRIASKFVSLVIKSFLAHGTIYEKYDLSNQSIGSHTTFGYLYNVVGFGWTNSVVLEFLAELPANRIEEMSLNYEAPASLREAQPAAEG